jgi:hypothetical protein
VKTRFVLHTVPAFGAFHGYLYEPFEAGSFKGGASGRVRACLEAGAAARFVEREVRIAAEETVQTVIGAAGRGNVTITPNEDARVG